MKIKILVALVFLSLLFLPSCQQNGNDEPEIKEYKGGIEIEIDRNTLPSTAIRGKIFPLTFKIKNTGNYPASGVVVVKGTSSFLEFKDPIGTSVSKSFSFNLDGRSAISTAQPEEAYSINVVPYLDPLTESKIANIEMLLCYSYSTVFKTSICIDTHPELPSNQKACTFRSISSIGQGAPINVVSVEQNTYLEENGKRKVEFVITLRNMMQGTPIPIGSAVPSPFNYCETGQMPEDAKMNRIIVGNIKLGDILMGTSRHGISFDCEGLGFGYKTIPFVNNEAKILCTAVFEEDVASYTTILEIPLAYGYYAQTNIPVRIVKH
ncbi:MAG: hypothetical protein PWQ87_113 [Candidatus Woesearchaeota archaeon]|nr:hypothetical protein [Candidatus Woesearchaeota archaeon]